MHVTDLEGNEYTCQATITQDYELNGNQSLSAKILPSKVNLSFIHDIAEMWTITDFDDVDYKIVYAKRKGEGKLLNVDIKAIPLFFDKFDTLRIYEEYNEHMTAQRCFSLIFEDSGFNFVIVGGGFEAVQWEGLGAGETRLSAFKRALERYKAEFRIVGNTVYLENLVGRDTQFQYRHRLNASNISQENDATGFWTYAKGYGDYGDGEGGEDWKDAKLIREYTSPLANIPSIGIRHAPPIKNGNITTEATMDEALKTLVDESLKISVTADIHDLRRQGYPLAQPEMGDRVFLIDERIGLEEEVRVVSMSITRNWKGEVLDLSLTFGTEGVSKRYQSNLKNAIQDIQDIISGNKRLPFSVLDSAVQEVTQIIKGNEDSVFRYMPNGVIGWNGDNPNYMTRYVGDAIGFSRDGGATFEVAMTAEAGIVADVIRSGTMLADRIAGGILSSLNGRTEFNLNSGILSMVNTEFQLGGGADIHFLDAGNRLYYQQNDWASGFGVGRSINDTYPYAHLGVSRGGRPHANDASDFSGFIANANDREIIDGIGNSVVGNRFHVRDKAVSFSQGFLFRLNVNDPYFSPINTGVHSYRLGTSNNRWSEIYGTLASTSTHNSKMNLEDIDGQQAFDYFNMMKVKTFFYKDEDYTNRFNRRASPVIEQLDPVLENIYKATEDSLDINSNLFLLAAAFQHYVQKTESRLEELENGTT